MIIEQRGKGKINSKVFAILVLTASGLLWLIRYISVRIGIANALE